tara:strand:- start:98 stop:1285 length:1188 start_codon:yes stop_codon:yes gene_type:complete
MSTLLKEAIVDAKALREAALKNAESSIVEKYSDEVRTALDKLLEQEDPMAVDPMAADPMAADPMAADPMAIDPMAEGEEEVEDLIDGVPLSATDGLSEMEGKNLKHLKGEGEEVKLTVDLDALHEAVKALQTEEDEDEVYEEEVELNEEDILAMLSEDGETKTSDTPDPEADVDYTAGVEEEEGDPEGEEAAAQTADSIAMDKAGLEENVDSLVDAIVEKLTVDMGADLSGWAGRSGEDMKYQIEKEMAHRRSTDVEEDLKDLKKAQEELVFENKQLKTSIKKHKEAVKEMKEALQEVNISNARLLYTNRVLRNTSLNERQKTKIAEAISNAGSVMEAKTIFETLESATPAQTTRAPQSLSEAINRPSSIIRASRREAQTADPFLDRMKKLAGIN